jgi:hypothetical protein
MAATTDTQTVKDTARDALQSFQQTTTRKPDAPASCLMVKRDTCAQWVAQAIKDAHDLTDLMPDDLTYEMAYDALAWISTDATDDRDDDAHQYADNAASAYTNDRLDYITSASHRHEAANAALTKHGAASIEDAAAYAWYDEARSVYEVMRAAVEAEAGAA